MNPSIKDCQMSALSHRLASVCPRPVGRRLRDLEIIKLRDLRRIFGSGFRCHVGRIVNYVTGMTAENRVKKTSKVCGLISSRSLSGQHRGLANTPRAR